MNESLKGLEQHEGELLMTAFSFLGEINSSVMKLLMAQADGLLT